MAIVFQCDQCGARIQAPDEAAGKKVRCSGCKAVNLAPDGPLPETSRQRAARAEREQADQESLDFAPRDHVKEQIKDRRRGRQQYRLGQLIFVLIALMMFTCVCPTGLWLVFDVFRNSFDSPTPPTRVTLSGGKYEDFHNFSNTKRGRYVGPIPRHYHLTSPGKTAYKVTFDGPNVRLLVKSPSGEVLVDDRGKEHSKLFAKLEVTFEATEPGLYVLTLEPPDVERTNTELKIEQVAPPKPGDKKQP